jgi:hypothetical protein
LPFASTPTQLVFLSAVRSTASDLLAFLALPQPSLLPALVLHGPSNSGARAFHVALVDGDTAGAERAGERRAVDVGRRQPIPGVDGPVGVRQGAQPPARLRRQLRPSA